MEDEYFDVVDDDGNRYTVRKHTRTVTVRLLSGQTQSAPGSYSLELLNGDPVNPTKDPDVFFLVMDEIYVRRAS